MPVFSDDEEERLSRIEEMLSRLQRQRDDLIRLTEKARLEAEATRIRVAAVQKELRQVRLESAARRKRAVRTSTAKT